MTRTYLNQFDINDQHPLTVPEFLLRAPWQDTSWGNDACPSFVDEARLLQVWVDYDKWEDRECDGNTKFTVCSITPEHEWVTDLHGCDSVVELAKFLDGIPSPDDLEEINTVTYATALMEAGKLLIMALDSAPDEEAQERVQAAIDEINTEVHRGDQG